MKRAFGEIRLNFWTKVQQTADRALKRHQDIFVSYQKQGNTFVDEKILNKHAASEDNAVCNVSFGRNPEESPQAVSSLQTGKIYSKSSDDKEGKTIHLAGSDNVSTLTSSSHIPIEVSKLQETLKNEVTTYLKIKHQVEICLSQENSATNEAFREKQFLQRNIPNPVLTADDCSSKEPKTYPVLFSWIKGGKEVYLTGDFSQWRPIKMAKVDHCEFSLCLYLPEGTYAYNFIVDDVMWHDDRMRYVFLIGKCRNKVVVKQEMYEESKALSAEFVKVDKTSSYMLYGG